MPFDEFEQAPVRDLTRAQERRLNWKFVTGDFGRGRFSTIKALSDKGYIEVVRNDLVLTEKAAHYIHHHGPKMPI